MVQAMIERTQLSERKRRIRMNEMGFSQSTRCTWEASIIDVPFVLTLGDKTVALVEVVGSALHEGAQFDGLLGGVGDGEDFSENRGTNAMRLEFGEHVEVHEFQEIFLGPESVETGTLTRTEDKLSLGGKEGIE